MTLTTTDPASGVVRETAIHETAEGDVSRIAAAAGVAAKELRSRSRRWRATFLRELARQTDTDRERLVATAVAETGLTETRLDGEITRCVVQFQLFADAIDDGAFLEAAIDHRAETATGPAPEIRRYLRPIGPVAVFGASNFPFAFSVLGGDTASALAAGNPVIVKAHCAHPLTSTLSYDVISRAMAAVDAPAGAVSIVYGQEAGARLVAEPAIKAVAFTGSLDVGTLLARIISERPEPIPFYGELSSVNPVVLTESAVLERSDSIAEGAALSVLGSGGQLCTKPGVFFVPAGATGQQFVDRFTDLIAGSGPQVALNERVRELFEAARRRIEGGAGVAATDAVAVDPRPGSWFAPSVVEVDAATVTPDVLHEAFGPLAVVVRYDSERALLASLAMVPPSLTATLHSGANEAGETARLVRHLENRAGRIVFDGFPTGVRVSWAQHHGGPWPATNSLHTSVGVTSVRRFLAPIAYQDAPRDILPEELLDEYDGIPRRVDGVLELARPAATWNPGAAS